MAETGRWQRVKDVFQAALERPAAERLAFVAETCGEDAELRSEVESLLAARREAGEFLSEPAHDEAASPGEQATFSARLVTGSRLGPYEIVEFLGAGGMGQVYKARDARLDRTVAIKVLPHEFAGNPARLRRFAQESRAAGALNHPNVLVVHDVGTDAGVPYLVSEYLEGETLAARLGAGTVSVRKAVEYGIQIARGLAAAHERGIVHRDIKPDNVLVTRDGLVKILDFGLAKPTGLSSRDADDGDTAPGALLGTVSYMSPEQVRGRALDHRSDIFSLGIVLYQMLSGHRPFGTDTAADTMTAILKEDPPPLRRRGREVPSAVETVVLRCLEKQPDERFQSGRDLAFALEAALKGLPSADQQHTTQSPHSRGPGIGGVPRQMSVAPVMSPPRDGASSVSPRSGARTGPRGLGAASDARLSYAFGPFQLDRTRRLLLRDGQTVPLTPKAYETLLALVENRGRVMEKDELMRLVWPDTVVEEANLTQNVFTLRKVLREGRKDHHYIATIPRRGYQFVAEVRRVTAGQAAGTRLIVLPFRILRSDPETDFLAFSLPDAITNSLSGLDALVVRSSLVAAGFADETPDLRRIAEEAGVDAVLTGTLFRAGAQLQVCAQLVEAPEGGIVWSQTSQSSLRDVFQLQDELVHRIVESLSVPLTAQQHRLLKHDVPTSARAYEFYLRANQLIQTAGLGVSDPFSIARDLYLRCLEDDRRYAPAWAGLARCHRLIGRSGGDSQEYLARAESCVQRALELNPSLPLAHKLYAQIESDLGRSANAMVRLLSRTRPRSTDPELFAGLVHTCRYCGLLEASVAAHEHARRLDPTIATGVRHTYWLLGAYDRALQEMGATAVYFDALVLASTGREQEAVVVLRRREHENRPQATRTFLASLRALLEGASEESLEATEGSLAHVQDPETQYYLARQLARLGVRQRALQELRRVVDQGFYCPQVLVRDPWLDPLRSVPEFDAILERAERGRRQAATRFVQAGGEALLGVTAA
jgi:serine/threonine protein kinase/TolB-like protein